jgi:ferritin-like metal-binding protein YciE
LNSAIEAEFPARGTLLEQTLQEEKETDEKLTQLAESEINIEADEEAAA